jgi:hypothetical protein
MRFVSVLLVLSLASCSDKAGSGGSGATPPGEGQRCTHFNSPDAHINGDSECQSPLICYPAFNTGIYAYDRCCPVNLADPSNVASCYSASGSSPKDASTSQ